MVLGGCRSFLLLVPTLQNFPEGLAASLAKTLMSNSVALILTYIMKLHFAKFSLRRLK